MPYKVTISTSHYVSEPASQKNWEVGTRNDFIRALDGWTSTENSIQQVKWRLNTICGRASCDEKEYITEQFQKWDKQRKNSIKFYDSICGFERTHAVCMYGIPQGYVDLEKIFQTLKEKGEASFTFADCYDIRQMSKSLLKSLQSCTITIKKVVPHEKG